jgi:hypothetical protein
MGGLVGLGMSSGAAEAASNDYDWLAIAYLWAADIGVDTRGVSADVSFSDVIDNLELGFQGHVETQGDDFGGFVDVSFMGTGTNQQRGPVRTNADIDMTGIDLAMVWSPGAERMTGLEVYGGLRYIDTDFSLVVDPDAPGLPELRGGVDTTYTDLLGGLRYNAPFGERWRLSVNADVSAFDTEGTWSLGMYGIYRMNQHRFIAGYRHLEMDLKTGHGEKLTETYSGPLIAYGYAF